MVHFTRAPGTYGEAKRCPLRNHGPMSMTPARHSRIVLAALAVLVLAILGGAAVIAGSRDVAPQQPGSAEAAVQAYFEALSDGRLVEARRQFTDELAERCPLDSYRGYPKPSRVLLRETTLDGASAVVEVRLTLPGGDGLLFSSDDTIEEQLTLVDTGQGWRLSEAPWPFYCASKGLP